MKKYVAIYIVLGFFFSLGLLQLKVVYSQWLSTPLVRPLPISRTMAIESIAQKVLKIEFDAGLIDDNTYVEALLVANSFIVLGLKVPPPNPVNTSNVTLYYGKLSELIDRYFFYGNDTTFAEGLLSKGIDCDLRSFLIKSIADSAGVKTSTVYSPGHAFIAWKAPSNMLDVIWETTHRGGRGVDFTRSVYKKTNDASDYTFMTDKESLQSYRYIADYEKTKDRDDFPNHDVFYDAAMDNPSNRFYHALAISQFHEKAPFSKKAILIADNLIALFPNSPQAHYLLYLHHRHNDNSVDAIHHLLFLKEENMSGSDLKYWAENKHTLLQRASMGFSVRSFIGYRNLITSAGGDATWDGFFTYIAFYIQVFLLSVGLAVWHHSRAKNRWQFFEGGEPLVVKGAADS